jgi:molecular chaperone GrpE (heat shock protein)
VTRKPPSAAQLETLRKTEDLQLTRRRVLHDIEAARNPRYKQMLTEALAHLDQELSRLTPC